jgi:cytochrome P450
MATHPGVVIDSGNASWRPTGDEQSPPSDAQLQEAARFVISPDGHADDASLQAAFKLLRGEAPVLWVDTPGMRPFWLLSRHRDISAVERRGSPFTAAPRTFLTSKMAEERLERILGKPYVLRGLLQMDDPDHAAYRAVAQPWFTPPALATMEPWLESWADCIVSRIAGRTDPFDFTKEIAVPFSIRGIMHLRRGNHAAQVVPRACTR